MKKKKTPKKKEGFPQEWKNIIFNIAFAATAILIVVFLYKDILITTFFEVLLGIVGLIKWKSKTTYGVFVVGGVLGALTEMIIIFKTGSWNYSSPSLLNIIPAWIIIIWANTSAYVYETVKELKKLKILE